MKKCIFFFGLVLSLYGRTVVGQQLLNFNNFATVTQVLPPSPSAGALGKYGGTNVNLSSGSLKLEIPIYQYASTNINVPISLSYNSSSFRVDEMSPATGMGWALNAGGVITRTVYGMADEQVPRMSPPDSFPQPTTNLVSFMDDITPNNFTKSLFDGQPDLFSFNFNGYSGRFVLDSSLANPILLTYSGIKIESHMGLAIPSDWYFRITTPDGVQYCFGGDSSIERSYSVTSGTGVGRQFTYDAPTSFYLSEIIHPNNDTVWLTYNRGGYSYVASSSEVMLIKDARQVPNPCQYYQVTQPTPNPNPKTTNKIYLQNSLLSQITSSSGARMTFSYIGRLDGGDSLLSKVSIFQPGQSTPFKKISLSYQYGKASQYFNAYTDSNNVYRPYLSAVVESSPDSSLTKAYKLKYNNINGLPPRLSYAQDQYGYFNGKPNNTLIPPPQDLYWQEVLPAATANRNVDSNYCFMGLLTNIIYPTGGQDSIVYEPNYIYGPVAIYPPDTSINLNASSTTRYQGPVVTDTITVQFAQQLLLNESCTYSGDPGSVDSLHDKGYAEFQDLSMSGDAYAFSIVMPTGGSASQVVWLYPGRTYVMTIQSSGLTMSANFNWVYMPGALQTVNKNQVAGGNRVKRIISNGLVGNTNIKRYYYGRLSTLGQSSGLAMTTPQFNWVQKMMVPCNSGTSLNNGGSEGRTTIECDYSEYDFLTMYSNTQDNLFLFSGSPVTYGSVTESFGENFENGGIEHDFTTVPDAAGANFLGNPIPSAPLTSEAWQNGLEFHQYVFKTITDGGVVPVKEVFTDYHDDAREDSAVQSYLVNIEFQHPCVNIPPDASEMAPYDLVMYTYLRKWMYVDTVRTLTYSTDGLTYVADTVITTYANPVHALPTKVSSTESDRQSQMASYAYPNDLVLTGSPETGRQALIAAHIISPVLQQVEVRGSDTMEVGRTDYAVYPNNLVLPQIQNLRVLSNPLEPRVQVYNYNNSGKVLEQSKVSDGHESYLWDYKSLYPIAKVSGAVQSDVAYTSFEADGSGNWTIPDTTRNRLYSLTGGISYRLTGSNAITRSSLTSTTTYIVGYWQDSSASTVTVNGASATPKITIGGWTYYEAMVTGVTTVTVGGTGLIDELKLFPKGSLMSTYTYAPLIGLTSQCDPTGKITFYTYDGLGRLKLIKDQYGNIIKRYDYQYQVSNQ
jgi:YD repeat-containing protein